MKGYDEELAKVRKITPKESYKYIFGDFPEVAPEVYVELKEFQDTVFIDTIWSGSENKGNVGKYLDSLPKDRRIIFPSVLSEKLKGMLMRRGYKFNEFSGSWIRDKE